MTNVDLAISLGISESFLMSLMYGKNAKTISERVLRGLEGLGVNHEDIGVDLGKPRKPGRPRQYGSCSTCGQSMPKTDKGPTNPS